MSPIDALVGFYQTLKETPGDPVTLMALADWFEEHGQPDHAACVRWTARRNRFPFEYRREASGIVVSSPAWHDGWYWWGVEGDYGRDWGHPPGCRLPRELWKGLKNHFDHDVSVFKHFPSLEAAYEALFDAWLKSPPSA